MLANRLTASGRHRVLLLEAGGSDERFWIRTPIGYGRIFYDPSVNWMYVAEADPGLAGRESYWPRGKVLGGSSSINAMVFIRGEPGDFDDWAAAGNPGWDWAGVLPYFRKMERSDFPGPLHGTDGPLSVSDASRHMHPLCQVYLEACRQLGFPTVADLNGEPGDRAGLYPLSTRDGRRESTATAYLKPARHRPNLTVITGAHATRILFEGRRAVGVAYRRAGGPEETGAGGRRGDPLGRLGELAAAAAALRRRPGPPARAPRHRRGGRQRGRRRQPAGPPRRRFPLPLEAADAEPAAQSVVGQASGGGCATSRRAAGRSACRSTRAAASCAGGPTARARTCSSISRPSATSKAPPRTRPLLNPDPYPGFLLGYSACRPTSRGEIMIRSADPFEAPAIRPGYLSTNHDIEEMVEGSRLMRRARPRRRRCRR